MLEHLFGASPDAQILTGSVGWDDEKEYLFDGGDSEDGHTLVRVQLFEGRDVTKPLNPKRAQGHKILCHISSLNGRRVPPKDSRVFVAVPKGQEHVPGAGVIFAAIEPQPARGGNQKPDETVIVGPEGSAGRVVFKKDGTVAIVSSVGNDEDGKTLVLSLGPGGLKFSSPYGSWSFDLTGFHLKTKYGPRLDMGGFTVPGIPADIAGAITGYCKITAPVIKANGSIVYLGSGPKFGPAVFQTMDKLEAAAAGQPITTGPTSLSSAILVSFPLPA